MDHCDRRHETRVNAPAQLLDGELVERTRRRPAGIGDENVQASEVFGRVLHESARTLFGRQVVHGRVHLCTRHRLAEFLRRVFDASASREQIATAAPPRGSERARSPIPCSMRRWPPRVP
jgi:hypothetical protein